MNNARTSLVILGLSQYLGKSISLGQTWSEKLLDEHPGSQWVTRAGKRVLLLKDGHTLPQSHVEAARTGKPAPALSPAAKHLHSMAERFNASPGMHKHSHNYHAEVHHSKKHGHRLVIGQVGRKEEVYEESSVGEGEDPSAMSDSLLDDENDPRTVGEIMSRLGVKHPARLSSALKQISKEDKKKEERKKSLRTPQFKHWFGDWEDDPANASKVVDAEGVPQENYGNGTAKVVYHGTGDKFSAFDSGKSKRSGLFGPGLYFTEDESIARQYLANRKGEGDGHLLAVYLNIRNPFDFERADAAKQARKVVAAAGGNMRTFDQYIKGIEDPLDNRHEIYTAMAKGLARQEAGRGYEYENTHHEPGKARAMEALAEAGYDGITHEGGHVLGTHMHKVWIAFQPQQVKHVQNSGTFDPSESDMYKSVDGLLTLGRVMAIKRAVAAFRNRA